MKNYFLKTFTICFFLFLGLTNTSAQEYIPEQEAIEAIAEKYAEVSSLLDNWTGDKTMDYYKAVSSKQLLSEMSLAFKQGKSTKEVAILSDSTMSKDKFQRIKPMFPDSNGKVGTRWIDEEIIVLLIKD